MSAQDLTSRASRPLSGYRGMTQTPLFALQREFNRLFDDIFQEFGFPTGLTSGSELTGRWPNIEVSQTDKEIRIAAEVPGLEQKDVEVMLENGVLTLRGEKRAEHEEKERNFSERFYGRFERRISVGTEIREDKVSATFKNGVLTVTMPKTAQAQSNVRRIAINGR